MEMKKQVNFHTQGDFIPICIEKDYGQCDSIVDLEVQKKLTTDFDSC